MHRSVQALVILGVLLVVVGYGAGASVEFTAVIEEAESLYPIRYQEGVLEQMIALYESVLPELDSFPVQSQAFVLNRLSQTYYESVLMSPQDDRTNRERYEQGKSYGLQSLRLNPQFAEWEDIHFTEAVAFVTDAAALLWTADNWGQLLGLMNPFSAMNQQGEVLALFSGSVAVDPDYFGGSASNALGTLLIMSPGILGGNDEAGLELLESAISDHPDYLANQVVFAEYWGFKYSYFGKLKGVRDAELVESTLQAVLDAEIGNWPFWNRNAKKNAEELLQQLEEMTR